MPDPTTLDRTARDARCAYLAATLNQIAAATRYRTNQPNVLPQQLVADLGAIDRTATAALARKVLGRRVEYSVRWHPDGDDSLIRMTEDRIGSLARARQVGAERVNSYGISHYTVERCVHITFEDGWTAISPWEKVDDRGLLFACGQCGGQVFRAGVPVAGVLLFDAESATDGGVVLIPSEVDGGEPVAIYRKPEPGQRRYHRHRENCSGA